MKPILYTFRRCPYAIRARMALLYSRTSVELREVRLNQLPEELLQLSPKGTVPVLLLRDSGGQGRVIEQSLDIIFWALSKNDPDHWLMDIEKFADLVHQNDHEFKPLLDNYKYADRHPHQSQQQHRNNASFFLQRLESELDQQRFLCGDRLSIADVAIMPFIRQFAGVEPLWFEQCEYKRLRQWLHELLESDLFLHVMHKYPLWSAGADALYLEVAHWG